MDNNLNTRVGKVEVGLGKVEIITQSNKELLDKHEKRIEKVEDSTAILGRMELLLSQQTEMNKEQNITLAKINDNLDNLNASQVQMQEEMKTMNTRIKKVEESQEEDKKKNTLDLTGLPKKAILWIVGVGLTALATWIYIKLGLK